MYHHIRLVLVVVLVVACNANEQGMNVSHDDDPAAVEEAAESVLAALQADDIDGILASLTPDHLTMAPNAPAVSNGPDLRAWHEARIAAGNAEWTHTTQDIVMIGDRAIQHWLLAIEVTPTSGGSPVRDNLKGIWGWERQADGRWLLEWSIWNSHDPLTAQ